MVPFTPGGSADFLGRLVGNQMGQGLGQQVVIDNRPGAGGSVACAAVAKADPDGQMLLLGHIGTLAFNPSLYPKLPYDPVADFAPVSMVAKLPNVLVVNPTVPRKLGLRADRLRPPASGRAQLQLAAGTAVPRTSPWQPSRVLPGSTSCTCPTRARHRVSPT